MSIVGQKFSSGEFFLPQMMIAARAMTEVLPVIKPHLVGEAAEKKGKAVIGTVAGDFHDIGKNIVKMMMEGGGYEVVDLGVDVGADKFVDAVKKEAPDFVLMSALITLTMESTRKTIEALNAAGLRQSGQDRRRRCAAHPEVRRRDGRGLLRCGCVRMRAGLQPPRALSARGSATQRGRR